MDINKVNKIVLDKTSENFEKELVSIIEILLRNKYEMSIRMDSCDFVIIEYDYDRSEEIGNSIVYWISEDDMIKLSDKYASSLNSTPIDNDIDPAYFFDSKCKR